ncbi:MAG: hypothetical protein ACHQQS_08315 [Thermoanaerobaculales bacterium]
MSDDEVAYYRVAEDHFAALRGTPFLFSPKDFALLRKWWREAVPLAAVVAGIGEAFERRREREEDPISSLSYCRYAVARHAKRLLAARVGTGTVAEGVDVAAALAWLRGAIGRVAKVWSQVPAVAAALTDLQWAVSSLPTEGDPAALEETLAELEFTSLDALLESIPAERRRDLDAGVEAEISGQPMTDEARARTRRALRLRAARALIGLPRLELSSHAS